MTPKAPPSADDEPVRAATAGAALACKARWSPIEDCAVRLRARREAARRNTQGAPSGAARESHTGAFSARRARRRVAQARWRKEAKARRAQFPLHKNFDELLASLPKCPAGYYRVLGDEFFSMHTLFWLGDYDTLEEAKRRADGLNMLYNWRGYVLDEHGNKVTL